MFTPHSTPSRPYIPRGTFSPTNKPPKPPIHNPYDKFTQPEFDVWIDDITGALRRALGHYTTPTNSGTFRAIDRTGAESESDGGEWGLANDSSEDESVDDSFGELRATHLKGKARDPREGPGLGGKNQPIEIESDPEGDEGGSEGGQPKHGWRGYSEDEDVNTELPGIDDGQGMNADEPIELISDKEDGGEREFRNTDEEIFEEDTDDFPPLYAAPPSHPLDLPDPWEGPRTFAEDFYAGGDFRENDLQPGHYSPSNLTPLRRAMVRGNTPVADKQRNLSRTNGRTVVDEEDEGSLPSPSPLASSKQLPVDVDDNAWDGIYDDFQEDSTVAGALSPLSVSPTALPTSFDPDGFRVGADAGYIGSSPPEFYHDLSEDDEDDLGVGAIPLGTSDLEIDRDAVYERREHDETNFNDEAGEGGLRFRSIEHTRKETYEDADVVTNVAENSSIAPEASVSVEVSECGQNEEPIPIFEVGQDDMAVETNQEREGRGETVFDKYQVIEAESPRREIHDVSGVELDVESVSDGAVGEKVAFTVEEPLTETGLEAPSIIHLRLATLSPPPTSEILLSNTAVSFTRVAVLSPDEPSHDFPMLPLEPGDRTAQSPADVTELQQDMDHPEVHRQASLCGTCTLPEGIPMPILANPNIPDLAYPVPSHDAQMKSSPLDITAPSPPHAPGLVTPVYARSPGTVPMHRSLSGASASGLFTPSNGMYSSPGTPNQPPRQEWMDVHSIHEASTIPQAATAVDIQSEEIGVPVVPPDMVVSVIQPTSFHEAPGLSSEATHADLDRCCDEVSLVPTMHRADPTNPILYSDPYPYSLSTPGSDLLLSMPELNNDGLDLPSEEDDHSTSSSTASKEDANSPEEADNDAHEVGLSYAHDSEYKFYPPSVLADAQDQVEDNNNTYPALGKKMEAECNPDVVVPHGSLGTKLDGKIENDHSELVDLVTMGKNAGSSVIRDETVISINEGSSDRSSQEFSSLDDPSANGKPGMPEEPAEKNLSMQNDGQKHMMVDEKPSRPSKRKQESSGPVAVRRTRSSTMKMLSHESHEIHVGGKRKGKRKATYDGDDGPDDNQSTSSSASSVLRMLRPRSQTASSASSISYATSADSSSIRASPSLGKQAGNIKEHVHPPLFHAHGPARHHPNRPPPSPKQQIDKQEATPPRVKDAVVGAGPSSQTSLSQRSFASSNSPVTRSNCRFHRISLPREEGGPRVCFLVPGCSLGNRELMDDQEIEDHGYATVEDGRRMIPDIESLDFSLYLVGILRQLVGVDLLREQEVYYLPPPGEKNGKARRKSASTRLSTWNANDRVGSPGTQTASQTSPLSRPPLSASTTKTSASKGVASERDWPSTPAYSDNGSDDSRSGPPSAKRRRNGLPHNGGDISVTSLMVSSSDPGAHTVPPSNRGVKVRRSRRLGIDAAEYKPDDEDVADSSTGEATPARGRRRKQRSQGIKRARTRDDDDDDQDRKLKHKKLRSTKSTTAADLT